MAHILALAEGGRVSPPIDLPEIEATERDAQELGVRAPAPALISDADLCAKAAERLAGHGWTFQCGVFAVHYPVPCRGSMLLPFPKATDPLQKHLSFVGHLADAMDACRFQISSTGDRYTVVLTASTVSPVHMGSDPDSLSRAALLALVGRDDV